MSMSLILFDSVCYTTALRSMNNRLKESANRLQEEVDMLSEETDLLKPEADRQVSYCLR